MTTASYIWPKKSCNQTRLRLEASSHARFRIIHQSHNPLIGKTIENPHPSTVRNDDPLTSQEAEMLRDVRLLAPNGREDLADASLAIHEQLQDLQSGRLTERLEQICFQLSESVFCHELFSL
jgi:hypothetical protein